jgi:hypothetical protein
MTKDLQLLKDVLSIPTFTYKEDLMVEFLIKWFNQYNIEYFVVEDVFNGADMGRRMIESLGNKLHYKKSVQNRYGRI